MICVPFDQKLKIIITITRKMREKTAAVLKAEIVQRVQDGGMLRLSQCENHWYNPTPVF